MPVVKILRQNFDKMMGKERTFEELDELGFEFGIEIEKDQDGDELYYKFECMNNRPDLLAETSLARAFKVYLQEEKTPRVKLLPPTISIIV